MATTNELRVFLLEVEGDSRRVLFCEARYRVTEDVKDLLLVH